MEHRKTRVYGPQLLARKKYATMLRRFIDTDLPCKKIIRVIGCAKEEFKNHIESQWVEGMSWENYKKEWCVDHIVPSVFFNHMDKEEIKLCWNHQNLKPLFHEDNHMKDHCPIAADFFLQFLPDSEIKMKLTEINNRFLNKLMKYQNAVAA